MYPNSNEVCIIRDDSFVREKFKFKNLQFKTINVSDTL